MQKKLSELKNSFNPIFTQFDGVTPIELSEAQKNIQVSSIIFDSREVKNDSLFFALPGTHIHGNEFIPAAIEKGANVIIFQDSFSDELKSKIKSAVEKRGDSTLAFCKVLDTRFEMAPVSACFYDNPSKKLAVFGVTGTEGKSSTVSFIWQLLRLCGKKAGFISTVQYSLGGNAIDNPQHQTTPEAPIIQRELYEMLENGCEYAVVETSSHGLSKKLNRTGNILFDCGIFMNVTLEHLEFHKTFEKYRNDKANLFRFLDEHDHEKLISGKKVKIPSLGIVNLEDASAKYFIDATKQKVVGFTSNGKAGKNAGDSVELPKLPDGISYLLAENVISHENGVEFEMSMKKNLENSSEKISVKSKLPGAFNAYNLMASALAVSELTGISLSEVASKIPQLEPVKGRMTVLNCGQPFEVIVDYAHTPSSFEVIFPPLKNRCKGKMICVFGSGGDRDLTKRPLQGKIAAKYCDIVILADEDPRGEDPVELLKMIAVGALENGKIEDESLFINHERPKAIRQAFSLAKKDDIVLLLGKSHENSIIYKDFSMPYDEISEAKSALKEMGFSK